MISMHNIHIPRYYYSPNVTAWKAKKKWNLILMYIFNLLIAGAWRCNGTKLHSVSDIDFGIYMLCTFMHEFRMSSFDWNLFTRDVFFIPAILLAWWIWGYSSVWNGSWNVIGKWLLWKLIKFFECGTSILVSYLGGSIPEMLTKTFF